MEIVWAYTFLSVLIVSIVSLIGVLSLSIKSSRLKKVLVYAISFSAGALFGDAFIHLIPEAVEETGFGLETSLYILLGIIFSFVIEKFIHWRHCHMPHSKEHIHPFAVMNLLGDGVHNFIDGLIIGASYLVSIPTGIATTIAVILHEIPQEIGDFGVLLQGGFSKAKALAFNFLTAATAVLGAIVSLVLSKQMPSLTAFLIPFAAGTFIYIAGSDLIPELHKEVNFKKSFVQLTTFMMGIGVMILLILLD